jgi:hypothetical protein
MADRPVLVPPQTPPTAPAVHANAAEFQGFEATHIPVF